MKKISSIFAIAAVLLMVGAGSSFAYDVLATNELKLGKDGTGGAADGITIGLSPKVNALYHSAGTTVAMAQWYAVGAVHPGGTKIYATASDLNNIVSKGFTKGSTIDVSLFSLPANQVSASDWSEAGGYKFD